jgi:ATP-binding cassette subfamily C protein CydC
LVLAGLIAALTELSGLALMATATYLLVRAAQQPPLSALTVAIVAVRALAISRGVLRYTERLAGHDAALRVLTEVRARVYASLAARRTGAIHTGDALSRLVSDVDAVQDLLLRCLVPAAAATVVAACAVAGATSLAPAAGAALAVGLLVAGVGLPWLAVALARRTADLVAPLRGALATDAIDLTQGAADLAAYGATQEFLGRAGRDAEELGGLERRLARMAWTVDGFGVIVAGLTAAAVTMTAMRAGASGVATAVLAVATLTAVEACLALVVSARRWVEIRASLQRVAEIVTGAVPRDREGAPLAAPVELVLDRVTVRYPGRPDAALSTVDLRLPQGRRVAVVGPSGAGKSTLLAVLAGVIDPDEGRLTANGRDLADHREADVRRAIGGLLADAHVFHATVRENLALGRPDATTDELRTAAKVAGLLDWIDAQPAGLETMVGEDGGQLSGGQRQRVALARAVLAAPAALLLDEPTEGLDPAAADRVLADVLTAAGGSTVVLVTHRLAELAAFDEVVVLDGGVLSRHT